jgi:hypothetical protein
MKHVLIASAFSVRQSCFVDLDFSLLQEWKGMNYIANFDTSGPQLKQAVISARFFWQHIKIHQYLPMTVYSSRSSGGMTASSNSILP